MGTKEQDVKAAESILNGRAEKIELIKKSITDLNSFANQLKNMRFSSKETVINGEKCTVSFMPGKGKTISLTFADDNTGNNFINQLP